MSIFEPIEPSTIHEVSTDDSVFVTDGRKLVTLRTIAEINPIEGADAIETATVDGWEVVVKKQEFHVGDVVVYFEIDSLLPTNNNVWAFLERNKKYTVDEKEYYRLKTIRLRKQISQGLILPLELFPEIIAALSLAISQDKDFDQFSVGLEKILGVKKFELPEPNQPGARGCRPSSSFPWWVPKTDEERIENIFNKYNQKYDAIQFRRSLKLDGSSITVAVVNEPQYFIQNLLEDESYPYNFKDEQGNVTHQLVVCSRNFTLKYDPESYFWKGILNSNLHVSMLAVFYSLDKHSVALQGEVMGPGVQRNRELLDAHLVFAFRLFDVVNQKTFSDDVFQSVCVENQIIQAPQYDIVTVFGKHAQFNTLEALKKASDIPSINHRIAEGLVYKSVGLVNGSTMHFKVINNKFLLDEKD